MNIRELCRVAHEISVAHGFYDPPPSVPDRLALIHSEVSEALEAYRDDEMQIKVNEKGKPEGFPTELADIVIRVCDAAQYMGIDLQAAIEQKIEYNRNRPHKHGRKRL